jgi:hypothetical protein
MAENRIDEIIGAVERVDPLDDGAKLAPLLVH